MPDRLVVVTGGTRGIGRAIVERFEAAGDRVVAVGRAQCDVTDEQAVARLFDGLEEVDVLVNNAGIASSAPIHRMTLQTWRELFEVNATAAFLCTRAVLPGMLERDRGRIVTVASVAGLAGVRYASGYSASKHAAIGFMRSTAVEVRGTGVTANAVCPTFVRTDMTSETIDRISASTGRSHEEGERLLIGMTALGRLLEAEEVAFAVEFLAAPEAGAINGQTLALDGGGTHT